MKILFFYFLIASFMTVGKLDALPLEAEIKVLEGEVSDWVFREKISYARTQENVSVEYDIKSHYLIALKGVKAPDKEALLLASNMLRCMSFSDPILKDPIDGCVYIIVPSERINPKLISGSKITISDYHIQMSDGNVLISIGEIVVEQK